MEDASCHVDVRGGRCVDVRILHRVVGRRGIGFLIMVGSAGWMALTVRMSRSLQASPGNVEAWLGQFRQKWRRDV